MIAKNAEFSSQCYLLNMPIRNGRHLVRSASRSKKRPIDSLMKLYPAIMRIE